MSGNIEIFIVGPGLANSALGSPGFSWTNKPAGPDGSPRGLPHGPLPSPDVYGIGSGFPPDMPPPLLLTGKQYGRLPLKDFEPASGSFWLISDPAKQLLESTDGDAFSFLAVEIRTTGAEKDSGKRWLCDVVRFLDALDGKKSVVRVTNYEGGGRLVQIEEPKRTHFRQSSIGQRRIFRPIDNALECYCSHDFKEIIRASSLTGLGFWPAGLLDT